MYYGNRTSFHHFIQVNIYYKVSRDTLNTASLRNCCERREPLSGGYGLCIIGYVSLRTSICSELLAFRQRADSDVEVRKHEGINSSRQTNTIRHWGNPIAVSVYRVLSALKRMKI